MKFLSLRTIIVIGALGFATGCSNVTSPNSIGTPNTGSSESESQFGALSTGAASRGQKAYVSSENLRMRSSAEIRDDNVAFSADMNDTVEILNPNPVGADKLVEVRIIQTRDSEKIGKTVFTSINYLDDKPVTRLSDSSHKKEASRYFVITNVATEVVRLYKRCEAPETCQNKMIMEFQATVGNNSKDMRSDVGVYNTSSWMKFYETGPYAGYLRPGYPELPGPNQRDAWLGKARPPGFKGPRGAFGWYTVMVGPNPNGQWMHGTIGWGADKEKFVRFQDSFIGKLVDIFAALGSHGCTRMSNEAIAFMRANLPVGATYIKVYAKEALLDPSRSTYPGAKEKGRFDYILTNLGAGQTNTRHDIPSREAVLAAHTPKENWMEEGTFLYDQTPDAKSGDHYNVGSKNLSGVFYVDQGIISDDYSHPVHKNVAVGGAKVDLPSFVRLNRIAAQ